MLALPYGAINIANGADTLALTTTAALIASFSATGGSNGASNANSKDSDVAVIPDKANNRIKLNAPGVYRVTFDCSVSLDTAGPVIFRLRKNGTAITDCQQKVQIGTTATQVAFTRIVVISPSDAPGTLPTFADPSSTGFSGAGGAPKTLCALDITAEMGTGSQTATWIDANLHVERIG